MLLKCCLIHITIAVLRHILYLVQLCPIRTQVCLCRFFMIYFTIKNISMEHLQQLIFSCTLEVLLLYKVFEIYDVPELNFLYFKQELKKILATQGKIPFFTINISINFSGVYELCIRLYFTDVNKELENCNKWLPKNKRFNIFIIEKLQFPEYKKL